MDQQARDEGGDSLNSNPKRLTGLDRLRALFRAIATERVTLLHDEIDSVFGPKARDREDLRALLNAGYRRGGTVYRCGGANRTTLEKFEVFGPKILAGLGDLPDTLASRCIRIRMQRRKRSEPVERFRARSARAEAEPIVQELEAWATHFVERLRAAAPSIPDALGDREADVWEPLLAIADLAGDVWPERARAAAVRLAGKAHEDARDSLGSRLLADVRAAFVSLGQPEHVSTADLLGFLNALDESPWGGLEGGSPLGARRLASLLKDYGIRPRSVRMDGETTAKGYVVEQFRDAFERYLHDPSETPFVPESGVLSGTTGTKAWLSQKQGVFYPAQDGFVPDSETGANPHGQTVVPVVPDRGSLVGENGVFEGLETGASEEPPSAVQEVELPSPMLGDEGYVRRLREYRDAGHLTTEESLDRLTLHDMVLRSRPPEEARP